MISEGAAVSQLEPSLQCWAPAGWSGCCTVNTAVLQPAQSVSQHQNTQRDCLVIKEGASSPEIRQIHCRAVNYIILYGISAVVWVSSGVTNKDKTTLQFNLIIRDCNARLSHSQWWITNYKLVFFSNNQVTPPRCSHWETSLLLSEEKTPRLSLFTLVRFLI